MNKSCLDVKGANTLCEISIKHEYTQRIAMINGTTRWPRDTAYVKCPLNHYTHQFLACDAKTSCWYRGEPPQCQSSDHSLLPTFMCDDHSEQVPYTLVCDHRADCGDSSDEDFCIVPPCSAGQYTCISKQCLRFNQICDGWEDCYDGADEKGCQDGDQYRMNPILAPRFVRLGRDGKLVVDALEDRICPYHHFQCVDNGDCLPLLLRCNGINDCHGHEDEADCDTCPGFYRCRASRVCLVHVDLCDGHAHCPQHDDELMCHTNCPRPCVCRGLAYFCKWSFTASAYPRLHFLDASGSGMTPSQLIDNTLLISLILANCSLTCLDGLFLPNLLILNVRDNQLNTMRSIHLTGVPQLRELSVAGNPLALAFEETRSFQNMLSLDLSRVRLHVLNISALSLFPNLKVLNLSHSEVQRVEERVDILTELRVIDLRGCPMSRFPAGIFQGLAHLQAVYSSNFKLCCSKVLPPDFNLRNCFAPSDEISSCDDLLSRSEYIVCVFVVSCIAIAGNIASLIFRQFIFNTERRLGFGNFVTHLSVSDCLMGVYLAILGVADQVYRGVYLWNDVAWRHSGVCKLAGILSLLSSEVSVLIMCLITLDRFLVLCFPFSRIRFSPMSAHTASGIAWTIGLILVMVPLLPLTSYWEFYSQTAICIPLPITRLDFQGQDYSFSVMIVFNFVLFVLISLGQLSIYLSVRANTMSVSNTTKKTKDLTIARRLITVALTDFLCWFPIGVIGLLAANGIPIVGEVNVAMAIFVLPINSAVNPCLYTFNVVLERRSRTRQEKLRAFILAQLKHANKV